MPRSAVFTVKLTRPSADYISVDYATSDGSAISPNDYTSTTGTITFVPGQTIAEIIVPVRDNTSGSEEEKFNLTISDATNATITTSEASCVFPKTQLTTQPIVTINNVTVASL